MKTGNNALTTVITASSADLYHSYIEGKFKNEFHNPMSLS